MQSIKLLILIFVTGLFLTSCEQLMEPDKDNHSTTDRFFTDPAWAEGVMVNAYTALPNVQGSNEFATEVATDDAVTNVKGNPYQRMATGEWSAIFDPMSVWNSAYKQLYYLNYFLSIVDKVDYAWDDKSTPSAVRDSLFKRRFKGEAKILRAWYNFELLKRHGGIASNGQPQGFIIMTKNLDRNENYNLPRNSYDECVKFILDDIDEGISLLPNVYANTGDVAYDKVFGNTNKVNEGRVNGRFAKALRSRVTLYVASQPFYTKATKWEEAAANAQKLLSTSGGGINGIAGLSSTGVNFWTNENDADILFRRSYYNTNTIEVNNFPPSRFGNGQTNPSQNLVDAFPMANGYPINDPLSQYNPTAPYTNRDPRLKNLIVYDGNNLNNVVVHTNVEDTKDGLNQLVTSTRTGYYLKKLLIAKVNLNPSVMSTERHFYTIFRYTEMFLNYAEAANEAWGPDADPNGYGFTPRTIIAAIRKRAGIASADPYLATITSKDAMRNLIRNERRIELSFEGFRFWDMRRWALPLNEGIKGMKIEGGTYTVIDVESRDYKPYMNYGPIPYTETLKSNLTLQNTGW